MLRKATANKLIARSADVLGNFYKAICQIVLQQDYVTADETYHKVLLTKIKPTDKGSKKGYLWAVSAPKLGLVFFVYEDGSRSEQVILNVFSDYKGTIQSDAYAPYRKLESDAYPDIMRIACLQHVKRDFIDCGKEDKDAQEVVDILNRFYREDKKHKVGVNGWTVEDHLAYRQSYAPDILQDLLEKLEEISSRKDLLPKSTLRRRSVMPLMNIMPFVTSSKEVIRLSITTILRESRGTYHYQEETQCSLARTKEQDVRLSYIPSPSHAD